MPPLSFTPREQHPLRRALVSLTISFLPFAPDLPFSPFISYEKQEKERGERRERFSETQDVRRKPAQSGGALKREAASGGRAVAVGFVSRSEGAWEIVRSRGRRRTEGSCVRVPGESERTRRARRPIGERRSSAAWRGVERGWRREGERERKRVRVRVFSTSTQPGWRRIAAQCSSNGAALRRDDAAAPCATDRPISEGSLDDMNSSGESGGTMTDDYEVGGCSVPEEETGSNLPTWEAVAATLTLGFLVLATVFGNALVILSVFTYRPLRIVQNFFIVSLAVADLAVAILVMPFNVAYLLLGKWIFGIHLCKLWLTCDVLCCTASILNLCAIALDRYWAITDPINYAQKRTLKRVLGTIAGVWILSGAISSPPLAGWNDWPEELEPGTPCQLTRRQGYVIYSSLGSFFIPLLLMSLVYLEIFLATRRRLRERARQSRLGPVQSTRQRETDDVEESVSSETNHNERSTPRLQAKPSLIDDEPTEVTIGDNDRPRTTTSTRRGAGAGDAIPSTSTVYQFIEERQRISLSKERRAARTLGVIMGVFVVCWLPFFLMYVIVPFCPACCPSDRMVYFITWLGYVNSALNPLIYTIFNLDYRRAFRRLLRIR